MTSKYKDIDDDCDGENSHDEMEPEIETDAINGGGMSLESQAKLFCPKEHCIWDPASELYNNKLARNNAWSRVCTAFDSLYDHSELHAKWTNLRIQYRYKSCSIWKFANALAFLQPILTNMTPAGSSACNSSIEDSNDSALNVSSAARKGVASSTGAKTQHTHSYRRHRPAPYSPASISMPELRDRDRDASLVQYLHSELRSLSDHEASVLRCRLQRTLLEFNEEQQTSLYANRIEVLNRISKN